MTLRWSVTPLQRSLGEMAGPWDALNQGLYGGHPLLAARFVEGLLKHFGAGDEHLCIGSTTDGQAAAMCVLRRSKPAVWSSFLPSQAQLAPTLVPDAASLPGLLAAVPGLVAQLDLLCNDSKYGDLASAQGPLLHGIDHAVTMNVSLEGDFDTYWEARPKQLRKNMRRYQRKLTDDGLAPSWELLREAGAVRAAVDRYAALEGQGWKGREGTALGSFPAQLDFFRDLMDAHAGAGAAHVFEMWLGDRLAASRLIVSGSGMAVILKTTYDETLQEYAPGRLLLHEVIRRAFDLWPGQSLEFYTNAGAEQLAWATGQRSIRHLTVYRNALVRSAYRAVRGGLRWLDTGRRQGHAAQEARLVQESTS
jgi:hypothetical protein